MDDFMKTNFQDFSLMKLAQKFDPVKSLARRNPTKMLKLLNLQQISHDSFDKGHGCPKD